MIVAPYSGPWQAEILRIIDGDTYDVRVRLPFFADRRERVRLLGAGAPEKNTEAGQESIRWVEANMPVGTQVWIQTHFIPTSGEERTLGRYLAEIRLPDGRLLAAAMIEAGVAHEGTHEG